MRVAAARDSFLVFGSPVIGQEEIDEVIDSLRSGWIGTGPKVQTFERELEEYVGVRALSAACRRAPRRCCSRCTCLDIGPATR